MDHQQKQEFDSFQQRFRVPGLPVDCASQRSWQMPAMRFEWGHQRPAFQAGTQARRLNQALSIQPRNIPAYRKGNPSRCI